MHNGEKPKLKSLETKVDTISSQISDVLQAVQLFSESVDKRFESVEFRLGSIEDDVDEMKGKMVTKEEFKSELNKFKTTMVTKGYLDDKLAEHHSDLVQWTKREIARAIK